MNRKKQRTEIDEEMVKDRPKRRPKKSQQVRVYELARKLGISSKEMVDQLKEYGVEIKTHMSTLDPETVELVVSEFEETKEQQTPPKEKRAKSVNSNLSVGELAEEIDVNPTDIIMELMSHGIMANLNQKLSDEELELISEKFSFEVKQDETSEEISPEEEEKEEDETDLEPRPPVITVMGHVDHGKTTLLDTIRNTSVTAREYGGITQHIGASVVEREGKKIVFIDTPGHEAFTAMRARGASVTDIVVLVVAADDGVMPQTVEAINHARAAGVPIIVAVNKIDKPNAAPDRVRQQLADHGLLPEEWGGETIFVNCSAETGEGVEELLDMLLLMAEMMELRANPNKPAKGTVIEARLDKGRGPVATVLIQEGTIRVGDYFMVGTCDGRVRAMIDSHGNRVKEAGPSTPVEIMGINDVPEAGDILKVMEESKAKRIVQERQQDRRQNKLADQARVTLDDFFQMTRGEESKELNIILRTDVQGSLEAVSEALLKLNSESDKEVTLNIIHKGVGTVTENDILLATASNAIIIGFNVRPNSKVMRAAESEGIEIRTYRVIYELLNDMKNALRGMLAPEEQEVILGTAEVRQVFNVPRVGKVAGCYVLQGRIVRGEKLRVIRDGVVIYEGSVSSLRRFKDDVREVQENYECGIGMDTFNDFKEGDILECFTIQLIQR